MRTVLIVLVIAAIPRVALAVAASESVTVARITAPMTLDPTLSDPRWQSASRFTGFTNIVTRQPAASLTRAALFYDDTNVYVAFWCDQSAPVTAIARTNNIGFGSDDYVGVGIDPTGNADRSYYFEMTPIGTRFQQASESARYTPHWQGATRMAAGRWTAMFIIPLSIMRLPSSHTQSWRINFVRYIAQGTQRLSWVYHPQMDTGSGFPDLFDARFWPTAQNLRMDHIKPRPDPTIDLYALSSSGGQRNVFVTPAGQEIRKNPRAAGLDLIYPLTGTMSFVAALNPDFSNVDADQLTITPQVFPRSLTEYRPFFAQGANYINNAATSLSVNEPPNLVFYSPSIGTFDRGLKVEGTYGKYESLGLLEARGSDDQSEQPFDDVAFGWKHVLPGRTFGYWTNGVVANHGGVHDSTVEFGTEARDLRTGWVGALFHERELGTLITNASRAISTYGFIDHQGPTHEALAGFRDIGPEYNPIDGYTQISDIRGLIGTYSIFGAGPPHSGIRNGNAYFFADRYFDESGHVHKADMGANVNVDLKTDFSIALSTVQEELRTYNNVVRTGYPYYLDPVDGRYDQTSIGLGYKQSSPRPTYVQYSWGPFGDYYLQQLTSTATRPLGGRFNVSIEYDGTVEKFYVGAVDSQWLRRISFGWSIDPGTTLSLGYRIISGNGGFASPGANFSGSLHRLYDTGNELYISFGTPAANQTIDRLVVKYLFKVGNRNG